MSAGEIAGLIAAGAFVVFVLFAAVPLLKLGRVLEEVRLAVRDMGHNTVPILQELKGTVAATNTELEKLSYVTEDVSKVTSHAAKVSSNIAGVSNVVKSTITGPLVKTSAFAYGVRKATKGKTAKRAKQ
ncbi:MAG: DUF948 domain-containing protein [Propionibacteriaceae bacterium]|jgi:uncharacterized protein YoxC|nr:DUF948 domain-containing protein [Propionibacteriaceae bacterium]